MSSSTAPATSSGVNRWIPPQAIRKAKRKEEVTRDSRAFSGSRSSPFGRRGVGFRQRHDHHRSFLRDGRWPVHDPDPAHGLVLLPAECLLGGARQGYAEVPAEEESHRNSYYTSGK